MHSLQEVLTISPSSLFRFILSSVGHGRSLRGPAARPLPSFADRETPCPSFLQIHMSSDCQRIAFAYPAIPTTQSSTVQLRYTFRPFLRQLKRRFIVWRTLHCQQQRPS